MVVSSRQSSSGTYRLPLYLFSYTPIVRLVVHGNDQIHRLLSSAYVPEILLGHLLVRCIAFDDLFEHYESTRQIPLDARSFDGFPFAIGRARLLLEWHARLDIHRVSLAVEHVELVLSQVYVTAGDLAHVTLLHLGDLDQPAVALGSFCILSLAVMELGDIPQYAERLRLVGTEERSIAALDGVRDPNTATRLSASICLVELLHLILTVSVFRRRKPRRSTCGNRKAYDGVVRQCIAPGVPHSQLTSMLSLGCSTGWRTRA